MRSKSLLLLLAAVFSASCASVHPIKPTVFIGENSDIPADIPSQFDSRYRYFISGDEMKEFQKLKTDAERKIFIDEFWAERDPDPTTPENEFKEKIDGRINDIASEKFFSASAGTTGLTFRVNDGFNGQMARVYLLHGEPDAMDILEEGRSFASLMLWVYGNQNNNGIQYAFLFYQKGGMGSFRLFYQDAYTMDPCGALYEIATIRQYSYPGNLRNCPSDLNEVYDEVWRATGRAGILGGNIFAWAIFNFSSNSTLKVERALGPPKPASQTAKESGMRIMGEAPALPGNSGTDYLISSCEKCNSMIPAEFIAGKEFVITAPWKNFDWTIKGETLELSLKYRVILSSNDGNQPILFEGVAKLSSGRGLMEKYPESILVAELLHREDVQAIPPGTYSVSVYIKNTLTGKYNAWLKEYKKQ